MKDIIRKEILAEIEDILYSSFKIRLQKDIDYDYKLFLNNRIQTREMIYVLFLLMKKFKLSKKIKHDFNGEVTINNIVNFIETNINSEIE